MTFMLFIAGVWGVWQSLGRLETFFEYSMRTLRYVYIHSANSQDLVTADIILRSSLEKYGPLRGKRVANIELSKAFPDMFDNLGKSPADMLYRKEYR